MKIVSIQQRQPIQRQDWRQDRVRVMDIRMPVVPVIMPVIWDIDKQRLS